MKQSEGFIKTISYTNLLITFSCNTSALIRVFSYYWNDCVLIPWESCPCWFFAAIHAKPSHDPSQFILCSSGYILCCGSHVSTTMLYNWLTTILNGCALVSVHQCLWACQHDVYNFFGALNMFVVVLMSCQLWFVLVLQTGSLCYGPLPVRWLSFVPSGRSQVPSLVLAVKKVLVHFHFQCTWSMVELSF